MRQTIESAPRNQEDIILEDDARGTFDVAHWSPEAGEWISENAEPSKITPTHWHPLPHDQYFQQSSTSSHVGRARRRFAAFSITAAFVAAALTGLYFRAEVATWVTGSAGQQDTVGAIGGQLVEQETRLASPAPRKTDLFGQQQQTKADHGAQAAVKAATAARQEQAASAEQQRHALQEERARAAALAREFAVARREIEANATQLTRARDDAAQFKQTAERTTAEQQKERESAEALSRELAMARREIEANTAQLTKARDDAAQFRQIAERTTAELQQERDKAKPLSRELTMAQRAIDARAALEPTPNSLITQTTQAVEAAAPAQPAAAEAQSNSEAARLMARASTLLARGNIGAARIVLERAAETGSAQATFMLAETYDPVILSKWRTYGTRGEATKARELYAKAQAGGIEEAKNRFDALTQ